MGEIADDMLDGTCCQICGMFMDEAAGYPVTCAGCNDDDRLIVEIKPINVPKDLKTIPCPVSGCKRVFRNAHAVGQHVRDKHAG